VYALLVCAVTATAQTPPARPAARVPTPPVAAGLTNADVVKMTKAGLNESLIIASIRNAEKRAFSLNADGLVELKAAGVSDNVVLVMLDPTAAVVPSVVERAPAQAADTAKSGAGSDTVLPASTVIAIRTIDLIKSNGAASDLEYRATVDDSVVVGGVTVAPVGTPAFLRVVQVQQAGAVNGRASLSLRLVGLEIDGRRLVLETGDARIASGSQAARATKSGIGGAVIGGLLGGLLGGTAGAAKGAAAGAAVGVTAAAVSGQSVQVPSETRLSFTVTSTAGYVGAGTADVAAADSALIDQFVALENKAGELGKLGDRSGIDAMLAPECTLVIDGRTLSRSQYLSSVKPQPDIISATIESPGVRQENDRTVVTGYYTIQIRQRSQPKIVRQKFRDVFVQREGRWMLLSSEVVSQSAGGARW
jgi:hypothetical protein